MNEILIRKLEEMDAKMILVRQLIEGWRNTSTTEEWGEFDQEAVKCAEEIHRFLLDLKAGVVF